MTLVAAFQTLLHRYTGSRRRVAWGPRLSTRDEPEAAGVVGCFINTLVLRCDLSGDPTFRELLEPASSNDAGGVQPSRRSVRTCGGGTRSQRAGGRGPLFEALLVLHNAPSCQQLRVPGLDMRHGALSTTAATVADLSLLLDTGERLGGARVQRRTPRRRRPSTALLDHLPYAPRGRSR
jgi:non-ribosomal peptide synthetase component F